MGHPQKGKHHKRKKSWHRGRVEHDKWIRAMRRLYPARRNSNMR